MAIVVVNYETRDLISQLVFSLYRVLGADQFSEIVVVDNGSRDGSLETLRALDAAGLIHLIANPRQRQHGPALNQAISWLARRRRRRQGPPIGAVLVLDSDVVVLRPELIADAVAEQQRTGAALLGQEEDRELLPLNCLLLDPALVWRPRLAPFLDRGDPSEALQRSVRRAGLPLATFPFRHHSYVLHLGRGTLQALARKQDAGHPLHAWALEHQDHHFGGHPYGRQLHADFLALYAAEVAPGEARIESLVAACRRTDRLRIPAARPLPPIPELLRRAEEGTLAELYDPSDA